MAALKLGVLCDNTLILSSSMTAFVCERNRETQREMTSKENERPRAGISQEEDDIIVSAFADSFSLCRKIKILFYDVKRYSNYCL